MYFRNAVERSDPLLDHIQLLGSGKIGLVEDDQVGKSNLLTCLGGFLELCRHVLRIYDGDHAFQRELAANALVRIQRLCHGSGLRKPGRLDDHGIESCAMRGELEETAKQIAAHAAANAAVVHLDHFLIRRDQEVMIDSDLAELVDDDGDAAAVIPGQYAVDERGFARAQKPRHDDDGRSL